MIIEQTVEIPASPIDVPRETPEGGTILTLRPAGEATPEDAADPAPRDKTCWRALIGIHKGRDTMEAYFKRHWAENDRERELEREQYPEHFLDKHP
jgi:hypothetical protein